MFPGTLIPKRIIFATVVSKHDALAFQKGKLKVVLFGELKH